MTEEIIIIDEEFDEPEEGDIVTKDYGRFYQYEKLYLHFDENERHCPNCLSTYITEIEEENEDILTDDAMCSDCGFYSCVCDFEMVTWREALRAKMEKDNFFPNVWFISDHGNAHLLSLVEE